MKKLSILPIIVLLLLQACNSKENPEVKSTGFDLTAAKSFIDSINKKFSEAIKNGDSSWLAAQYGPDAEILFTDSEPIKGKDILVTWGSVARSSERDWTFTTTDLQGDENFLVETGKYEIKDDTAKLASVGKYLVTWKKYDGQWKLYRDMGNSSPMPGK